MQDLSKVWVQIKALLTDADQMIPWDGTELYGNLNDSYLDSPTDFRNTLELVKKLRIIIEHGAWKDSRHIMLLLNQNGFELVQSRGQVTQ